MGDSNNVTSTQTTVPWQPQQPYFLDVWKKAQGAYNKTPKNPYLGNYVAPRNAFDQEALGAGQDYANALAGIGQPLMRTGQNWAAGGFATDPTFLAARDAAIRPVTDTYTRSLIPNIRSASIANGAYGGTSRGIQIASSELERNLGDITGGMSMKALEMAPSMIQQGAQLEALRPQALTSFGDYARALGNLDIQNQLSKYQATQQAPWIGLNNYIGALGGQVGSQSTTSQPGPSTGASLIQGALGGAGLGAGLAQALGQTGSGAWPYALGGGILGTIGSFF